MKVINLMAGPGTGKSTTAAGLFHFMKLEDYRVELVTEYIKTMAYEGRKEIFSDQVYIFGKQQRRQHILRNQVDWIVTDSPLILSGVYAPENYFPSFEKLVMEAFNSYNNHNFFLKRVKTYHRYGRGQTEEEARAIDVRVLEFLYKWKIPFTELPADRHILTKIMQVLRL